MREGFLRRLAAVGLMAATAGIAAATPATVAAATTIVVNTLGDSMNGVDGECSLREAIAAVADQAPSGGIPGECPGGSGTDTITFKVGGTIYLLSSLPAISTGTLTIDGGDVITIDGQSTWALLKLTAGTFFIRNLVLAHGNGNSTGYVNSSAGTTTLTNVVLRDNAGSLGGGGIRSVGTLTLDRVWITGNQGHTAGAGVYQNGGSLTIKASRVDHNTVFADSGSYGGGVYGVNTTVSIDGTRIEANTAQDGGGIAIRGSPATISNSHIADNDASNRGGGIYVDGDSYLVLGRSAIESNTSATKGGGLYSHTDALARYFIRDTTFFANTATNAGGAISGNWDWMDVRASTFASNASVGAGGAVYQGSSNATSFVNVTFASNSATDGGAVYVAAGGPVLLHTTVTDTSTEGSSAALDRAVGASMTVRNSIVAGNAGGNLGSGVAFAADDVISTSATGILDPAGLQDNGGPTKTVKPLKSATSVIGKGSGGDGCGNANVEAKDQRGVTRPSTGCDIGAVQLESKAPTASAPRAVPAVGSAISSTVPVRITAPWSDPGGSGVKRFVLQKSVNGGSWSTVTSTMPASGITLRLSTGSSYRFRVKPVDYDGNVGSYTSAGTAGTPAIRQQSYATYSGSWSSSSSTSYSGGSVKKSSSAGASAKYVFTGRAIGFVTTLGPTRGKVKVYLDGTLKATVDLYASSTKYKVVAWSQRFSSSSSHTLKLVVVGSPSRPRVDVDAFTVLK